MHRQLSLFDSENLTVSHIAGFTAVMRAAMNRAAAASPYSRQQIVDRMNDLAGAAGKRLTQGNARKISLETLEKWLNPESDHVPGLLAVEVFMRAVGGAAVLETWAALHNCEIMNHEDRMYRDLGRLSLKRKSDAEAARELEAQLKRRL